VQEDDEQPQVQVHDDRPLMHVQVPERVRVRDEVQDEVQDDQPRV
jgi:hypothetical protein